MANILMIVPALYCCGGLQKISLQLSSELINVRHKVIIVDTYNPNEALLYGLGNKPRFERLNSYNTNRSNLADFISFVDSNNIDLIIYQGFFPIVNRFLKEFHKLCKTPIVSVYHNSPDVSIPQSFEDIMDKGIKGVLKRLFFPIYLRYSMYRVGKFLRVPGKFSEHIILLSKKYVESYQHLTKLDISPIVIPNFIPGKTIKTLDAKKKQIIYVGRLEESQKRVLRSIKIWEKISYELPDWELLIAGDGRCKELYQNYIKDNNIPRISLLGNLKDPSNLYEESSILMLTSDKEGFPLVLLEAMLRGCVPVVYDSYLAASDIIENEKDGLLVKPFEEEEFCSKVIALANDKIERGLLASNAIKKGLRYQPSEIIPKWQNIINQYNN